MVEEEGNDNIRDFEEEKMMVYRHYYNTTKKPEPKSTATKKSPEKDKPVTSPVEASSGS